MCIRDSYKNKGDRRLCDNHRGIPLLTNAGNIFARVFVNRLTIRLESTFSESQCSFRSSRGITDMLFAARQALEKCREQNLDLYMVFVDLTKPFDSVNREGLWKLYLKAGYPLGVIKMIRSFHDGMMAGVSDLGTTSEAFPETNATKQSFVMAELPLCIISAMLHDVFRNCNSGAMIRLRSNGGLFNLQRLKVRTKVSLLPLHELLFADDCALIAHNEDELQSILNDFPRVASRYGFTISIFTWQSSTNTPLSFIYSIIYLLLK